MGTTLPNFPTLAATLKGYTLENNVLTLNCSYTANWNFPLNTLEVQGSMGSENFDIINVTYTGFDIVINSAAYNNAVSNNGGTMMVTTTGWGQWQNILSSIILNETIVTSSGNIKLNAIRGNDITITTTTA